MRAFSVCGTRFLNRTVLCTLSANTRWCSTEPKTEPREAAEKPKAEEVVSAEAYEKLAKELEQSKKLIDELKRDVMYRAADAENARRIGREDVDKAKLYGITSFGKDMLEVIDTLEKGVEAFATVPESLLQENKHLASISTGVKLSIKVLLKNLSKHGIEKMNVSVGTPFDHNLHDAIVRTPTSDAAPSDHVSYVMKDGYTIKSRVLRAAQVGVASDESNQ